MKNKMFSGCKDVFNFTLKQALSSRYKIITAMLALIFLIAGLGINIAMASGQKKDDNISPVKTVYLIDESGLAGINWNDDKNIDKEQFPETSFEVFVDDVKKLGEKLADEETESVIAKITKEKDHYQLNIYLPHGSSVSEDDGANLAKAMKAIVHDELIAESGIDAQKVVYVTSDMDIEFSVVGEDAKSDIQRMLTTVFPLILMFVLYFMVIIYGQSMGQVVSIEKSSKLMETLLVSTRPDGLIFGKILATSFAAILQIGIWVVAAVGGFVVGDSVARNVVYADYDNFIFTMLKELAADNAIKAFSTEAIVLSAVAVCMAFLFYGMLAGAIASFASKADELGSVMVFYNLLLVMGFLGSYVIPAAVGQEWIKVVLRLIPVSSAFLLPGEIIIGTIPTGPAVLYVLALLAWIAFTAFIAGKVYCDQVFYRGKSLKDILPWIKKKEEKEDGEQWQILHDEAGRPLEKSQRILYFFMAAAPIVIFFIIQIFGSIVLTNVMTRVDLRNIDISVWEVKDYIDYYHGIENILNPMTMMVCHLLIISTFGVWFYFVRRGIDKQNIIHIKTLINKKPVILCMVCVMAGLCLCFLANGVVAIEAEIIPSVVEEYIEMAQNTGMGISPFAIFAAVCLAPIGEELLCRGVCLHFGKKAFGKFWYANILQALVFGILHMNWVQGVYAFFIGLVLGVLVERYDSLLPAMIVHFIVNFSSSTWVPKVLGKADSSLTLGIIMVLIPGLWVIAELYLTRKVTD